MDPAEDHQRRPDPTELWRSNFLGCFIRRPVRARPRPRIGIDSVALECDYPHSNWTWPTSPRPSPPRATACPSLSDADVHRITWENACRFFRFDPFEHMSREEASVGALRSRADNVDTSTTSRAEYKRRYQEAVAR